MLFYLVLWHWIKKFSPRKSRMDFVMRIQKLFTYLQSCRMDLKLSKQSTDSILVQLNFNFKEDLLDQAWRSWESLGFSITHETFTWKYCTVKIRISSQLLLTISLHSAIQCNNLSLKYAPTVFKRLLVVK